MCDRGYVVIVDDVSRRFEPDFCRLSLTHAVTRRLLASRNKKRRVVAASMSLDMIDLVWSLMRDAEFYSPADLANTLGQPTDMIARILEFLSRYKFVERMTKRELIFRKIPTGPSPAEAVKVLRMLRANAALNDADRIADHSRTSRRPNLV